MKKTLPCLVSGWGAATHVGVHAYMRELYPCNTPEMSGRQEQGVEQCGNHIIFRFSVYYNNLKVIGASSSESMDYIIQFQLS